MKEFWSEGQLYLKLLSSDPFAEGLFHQDDLNGLVAYAEHQAKSHLQVLGFKNQAVKRKCCKTS